MNSYLPCTWYYRQRGLTSPEAVFKEMENDPVLKRTFPNMYHLLLLSLIIPSSTAAVERSFSLMNALCTPLRNRLTTASLDAVMRICHEGPTELDDSLLQKITDDFISAKDRKIKLN